MRCTFAHARATHKHKTLPPRARSTLRFCVCYSSTIAGSPLALFVAATFVAFGGALHNEFVNWDDNRFIYENPFVQKLSGDNLYWIFFTSNLSYWHPLTMLSHALDFAVWGANPHGHHVGNLVLHALNMWLVYLMFLALVRRELTARVITVAIAVVLVWGVHPLRVESVAWATERSDVLCATFMLATVLCYLRFVAAPRPRTYVAVLACFAGALAAKPLAVTMPVLLLLLDFYLGKLTRKTARTLVMQKLPLLVLALVDAFITVQAQEQVGSLANAKIPLWERLMNAMHSIVVYPLRTLWPANLSPFYPLPTNYLSATYIACAIVVIAFALYALRRRGAIGVAFFAYLIVAAPVIGIVQAGGQASADRFTYLPTLPFYFLAGGAVLTLLRAEVSAWWPIGACAILVLELGLCRAQVGVWQDSRTLWETVAALHPDDVPMAHNNLGAWFQLHGDLARAETEYKKTIEIFPAHANAHNNLGYIYQNENQLDAAAAEFEMALQINPHHGTAWANLAANDYLRGRYAAALEHVAQAQAAGAPVNPALLRALEPYRQGR